ncbi:DUF6236 family protein [Mesobacillus maritimus]|uniref:Uncharacterized protein n=1 Tax=Mesobacillus maritimus TaxID=1643336 RepID=A0ABS7K558_9BACI|nr:DUF6236 family protein [Mesobacillus maritimus]MBY0097313.1 hypothetical protein [Mesobacillus maritimus]
MKRTILYFPRIEIPDGEWLRNSLLYWDDISSIVPETPEYSNNSLSPELDYLLSVGEYRPLNPGKLLQTEKLKEEFETELTSKLRDYLSNIKIEKNNWINHSSSYHIYRDKLTYKMIQLLKNEGVLSEGNSEEWVSVEEQVGYLYMSLLAKYLAKIDKNHTVIGTDQAGYYNFTYPTISSSSTENHKGTPILSNQLNNILPTPVGDVPFEEIVDFKKRHRDELLQFRTIISEFENEIGLSESFHEVKEKVVTYKEKIEFGTNEVAKALRGSQIKFIFSSLYSLVNTQTPNLLTDLLTPLDTKLPIDTTTIGAGLTGSIVIGGAYLKNRENLMDRLSNNAFVYLYHANKQGIVSNS